MNQGLIILNCARGTYDKYCPTSTERYKYNQVVKNIINLASKFDPKNIFYITDKHQEDDFEFCFLPKHFTGYDSIPDTHVLAYIGQCEVLTQNSFSCLDSEHNRKVILRKDLSEYLVCGFHGCFNIIPTCLSLIHNRKIPIVIEDYISDIDDSYKDICLKYLSIFGILKSL